MNIKSLYCNILGIIVLNSCSLSFGLEKINDANLCQLKDGITQALTQKLGHIVINNTIRNICDSMTYTKEMSLINILCTTGFTLQAIQEFVLNNQQTLNDKQKEDFLALSKELSFSNAVNCKQILEKYIKTSESGIHPILGGVAIADFSQINVLNKLYNGLLQNDNNLHYRQIIEYAAALRTANEDSKTKLKLSRDATVQAYVKELENANIQLQKQNLKILEQDKVIDGFSVKINEINKAKSNEIEKLTAKLKTANENLEGMRKLRSANSKLKKQLNTKHQKLISESSIAARNEQQDPAEENEILQAELMSAQEYISMLEQDVANLKKRVEEAEGESSDGQLKIQKKKLGENATLEKQNQEYRAQTKNVGIQNNNDDIWAAALRMKAGFMKFEVLKALLDGQYDAELVCPLQNVMQSVNKYLRYCKMLGKEIGEFNECLYGILCSEIEQYISDNKNGRIDEEEVKEKILQQLKSRKLWSEQ